MGLLLVPRSDASHDPLDGDGSCEALMESEPRVNQRQSLSLNSALTYLPSSLLAILLDVGIVYAGPIIQITFLQGVIAVLVNKTMVLISKAFIFQENHPFSR